MRSTVPPAARRALSSVRTPVICPFTWMMHAEKANLLAELPADSAPEHVFHAPARIGSTPPECQVLGQRGAVARARYQYRDHEDESSRRPGDDRNQDHGPSICE